MTVGLHTVEPGCLYGARSLRLRLFISRSFRSLASCLESGPISASLLSLVLIQGVSNLPPFVKNDVTMECCIVAVASLDRELGFDSANRKLMDFFCCRRKAP